MDLEDFVNKSVLYGIDYFLYTLNSLIDDKIAIVKSELESNITTVDINLIEDIATLLSSLKGKNSKFQNIIYAIIGIEADNSKSKIKLKALLDKIDTDFHKVELEIEQNQTSINDLEALVAELKELKSRFINFSKKETISKLDFYLSEIDDKIKILDGFGYTMLLKSVNLLRIKQIYISLQRIKSGTDI